MVVGRHLAERGVLGRFAVDFVVVQDETGEWTPYAIELNLRKGGTTHPFLTLQFLCGGNYDGERGVFLTPGGTPKVEQASHQVGLFDAWARFWARQGVDLEQQPVRMWGDQSVVGVSAFIATQDVRPERAAAWEGWLNRLQVITQAERLQQDTLSPAAVRSSPRL